MLLIRQLKTGCTEWTVNSMVDSVKRRAEVEEDECRELLSNITLNDKHGCLCRMMVSVSRLSLSNDGVGKPTVSIERRCRKPTVYLEISYCVHSVQQNLKRRNAQPVWT